MMLNWILAAFFIFLSSAASAACPLGAKENHLTVQRVMRNFGRFINPAEMIAYRGQNKYEIITDAQLQEAIEKLSLVISCANAVIENPTGDLLPVAARGLPATEKSAYVEDYVYFMQEFKDSLTDYQDLYIKLLAQDKAERHFDDLMQKTKTQNNLIDRAHKKL